MSNVFTQNPFTPHQGQPAPADNSNPQDTAPAPTPYQPETAGKKFDYLSAKKNGVSDQEIFDYLQQQKSKGVDIYIDKNDFHQYQQQNNNQNQNNNQTKQDNQTNQNTNPEKKGFWSGLADSVIRPFAEVGVSAVNAGKGIGELASGLYSGKIKPSDFFKKGSSEELGYADQNKNPELYAPSSNLPFLGKTEPAFTGNETLPQFAGKTLSYGSNIGSWFIGGSEAEALGKGVVQGAKELGGQTAKDIIKGKIIPASLKAAKEFAPVGTISGLGKGLQEVSGDKPVGQNILGVAGNTAMGTAEAAGGAAVFSGLFAGGGKVVQKVIDHYAPIEEKANNAITEAIDKAVKPTVSKVNTPQAKENYYNKAIKAFEVVNKYKTAFPDESGNMIERNPHTVSELFDAIGQAKKQIFNTYDQVAKKSGEMGARFNAEPTVSKLEGVESDIGRSPEIRQYARKQINAIKELHGASPSQIQTRIEEYNNALGSFYDGRISKAKADIDASVAYSLRQDLENLINKSTGENYQYFKNEYGSLSSIEKDIGKSSIVEARKASKGMLDFTDVFTGGDITSGILTMNPTLIAKGLAGKGIKGLYKTLNNPDRYIKNAFDLLDKIPPEYAPLIESSIKLLPAGKPYPKVSVETPISMPSKTASTIDAETVKKFGNGGRTALQVSQKLLPVGNKNAINGEVIRLRAAQKDFLPKEINNANKIVLKPKK